MTASPRYVWPTDGILQVPAVAADGDVPTPDTGLSVYFLTGDGTLKGKKTDGSIVTFGPSVAPAGISPIGVAFVNTASAGTVLGTIGTAFTGALTKLDVGEVQLTMTTGYGAAGAGVSVSAMSNGGPLNPVIACYDLDGSTALTIALFDAAGAQLDAHFTVALYVL